MKLSKNNWLVRFAWADDVFLKEGFEIPKQTTLCHLLACVILKMPLFGLFLLLFGGMYVFFIAPSIWIGTKIVAISKSTNVSIFVNAAKDFKNKTCTKIEIE